jgi:hypothetical protein
VARGFGLHRADAPCIGIEFQSEVISMVESSTKNQSTAGRLSRRAVVGGASAAIAGAAVAGGASGKASKVYSAPAVLQEK